MTDFLLRAREQGVDVPEAALKKATGRILYYLNNPTVIMPEYSADIKHLRFSVQAYAGYVLARTRQAPLGALRAVHNRKDEARSGLSLVHLGIALNLMGDTAKGDALIRQGIHFKNDLQYVWYGDYGSRLRDDAMICALLSEHNLGKNERDAMLFRVSDLAKDQLWLSTQERNALFLAGRFVLSQPEANWTATLDVGGETVPLVPKASGRRLADAAVVLPLTVSNTSEQTL